MTSQGNLVDDLVRRHQAPYQLTLQVRDVGMRLHTNVAGVRDAMAAVYARYVKDDAAPKYTFWAIDGAHDAGTAGLSDYVLPNGKVKETYRDEAGVRTVVKRKTGLVTVFDDRRYVVMGPVEETENQLNNIINAVYMKDLDERGYLICQTAGMELGGAFFAIAGRSGAGKTTSMLKLMEAGGSFVSNDRLLVKPAQGGGFEMWGIPKWPRVNAGTMMGDDRLRALLPADARARYAAMSYDDLFQLEEKYDLDVEAVYGKGRWKEGGLFHRMYYLMWSRDGSGFGIDRLDAANDAAWDELGPNLYRDAGVFDRRNTSSRWRPEVAARYRKALAGAEIWAIRGKVDFPAIGGAMREHLGRSAP